MSWFGLAKASDLAEAKETARGEARRAKEALEREAKERADAKIAREKATASESRTRIAEYQAQEEKQRANEEKGRAEKERIAAAKAKAEASEEKQRANEEKGRAEKESIAAAKAKAEAIASAQSAQQAEQQAQSEKQKRLEADEIARKERENVEEARAHAQNEARKAEEMRREKETAEQEKQRLEDEKEEKQRRDEQLMQFAWGPRKPESTRWTPQEVERLHGKFYEHMYDKEGSLIQGKILIFGPSGAGKSSFCNGLRSALKDSASPANYYAVGIADTSLTSGFQAAQYGDHWIIDMPGIFESREFKTENIEAIASGKVRFDAEITKTLAPEGNLQKARRDVSCVVLVLYHGLTLGEELKRHLDAIIKLGGDGALSYHLVLTHLDECDLQFKDPDNIPNLYSSPLVQESVKMMSEQTGIPAYAISYVKNYVTEKETDTNTKLLHLKALDSILNSTFDQVEKMIDVKLRKKMYDENPDTEVKKDASVAWTIPVLILSAVIALCAVIYMYILWL